MFADGYSRGRRQWLPMPLLSGRPSTLLAPALRPLLWVRKLPPEELRREPLLTVLGRLPPVTVAGRLPIPLLPDQLPRAAAGCCHHTS